MALSKRSIPTPSKVAAAAPVSARTAPVQMKNDTGLPDNLKAGVENLSGYSLDDVKVHYNSPQPTSLQAHAYAQGTDIHVAPGQERHLPHEAWHVVQQKQGRVKPTRQLKGIGLNDEGGLEAEADQMGALALSAGPESGAPVQTKPGAVTTGTVQRALASKESIFIDQVKMQAVRGLAILSGDAAEDEDCEKFVLALRAKGLLDANFEYTGSTQKEFLDDERDSGLVGITLTALQDQGLIVEAVKLAEIKSSWVEYKTKPIEGKKNVKNAVEAKGVGGKAQSDDSNVSTRIKWGGVGVSNEGTKVTALVLAPDHPLGSTPSGDAKKVSQTLSTDTGKPYIAGHLLNDHLGGPGNDKRNITALPKDVNTEQSDKVEEAVKKIVNLDHKIAFYQVEAIYQQDSKKVGTKKHHYAASLVSTFGVYKEGTDFSKLAFGGIPDSELDEKFVHTLPIRSPSEYKGNGQGYTLDIHGTGYQGIGPRDPSKLINLGGNGAKMKVDKHKDVLLKDDKQIKLEFLSAAISSLQIRELNDKVSNLELQVKQQGKELGDKTEELKKLKDELGEKDKVLDELKLKILEVEDLAKKEAQQKAQLEGENEALVKENQEMALLVANVKKQLNESNLLLQEVEKKLQETESELSQTKMELENTKVDLDHTKEDSRFRIEQLGGLVAKTDENPQEYLKKTFRRGPSPESQRRYMQGVTNFSGPKLKEEKPQINMEDITKGYEDGFREGEKEGKSIGYRDGWNNWHRLPDPFVFVMGPQAYQNAYTTAYKQAYAVQYGLAYDRGVNDYDLEYRQGYDDGNGDKQAQKNNDAYWKGYDKGMNNLGYRDGNRGYQARNNYQPYMKGYNWGMYDWGDFDGRRDREDYGHKNYRSNNQHYREGYDKSYSVKRVKKEHIK